MAFKSVSQLRSVSKHQQQILTNAGKIANELEMEQEVYMDGRKSEEKRDSLEENKIAERFENLEKLSWESAEEEVEKKMEKKRGRREKKRAKKGNQKEKKGLSQ